MCTELIWGTKAIATDGAGLIKDFMLIYRAVLDGKTFAAETMVGRDGVTAHALPHDALVEVMTRYGRGPSPVSP